MFYVVRSQHAPRRRLLLAYTGRFPDKAVGLHVNTGDEEGVQRRMASKAGQVVGSQRQRKVQAEEAIPGVRGVWALPMQKLRFEAFGKNVRNART